MNPILHQWKWDFRRIRLAWILWLLLLVLTTVLRHLALSSASTRSPLLPLSTVMEMVVIFLLGPLLVAFAVFTTPFSGSTVFWKTRPMPARAVFWEKTLLILALVWIPVLLSRGIQYLLIDSDPAILSGVALTYLPLTLALYFLAATWSALCSNLRNLTLCLAGTVGFAMLLGMLSTIVRRGSPEALIQIGSADAGSNWQTLVTALFLMAVILIIAWFLGALLKRPAAAAVTAALAILVLVSQNSLWSVGFGNGPLLPERSMDLVVLDRDQEADPSLSILYPQLAANLPADQILMPITSETRFVRTRDQQQLHSGSHGRTRIVLTNQLRRNYPADASVISSGNPHSRTLINGDNLGRDPGTLSGSYTGVIFKWRKLGSLPLATGATQKLNGHGIVRVGAVRQRGDEFEFEIHSVSRNRDYDRRRHLPLAATGNLLAILRHSDTGTLVSAEPGSTSGSGGFNLVIRSEKIRIDKSTLHSALGRNPSADDLSEFELDLYSLTPLANATGTFRKDHWIPFTHRPGDIDETVTPADAWTKATLPDNPTNEQVGTYLNTLVNGLPRDLRNDEQQLVRAKFNALGAAHLDHLIDRLPAPHYFRHYIDHTIRKHATRDHLPSLLAAFERDSALAAIFVGRRWQQEAIDIAREHLRASGPFSSRDTTFLVLIATTKPDLSLNDDLLRHFVLSGGGHSNMIPVLRKQPGFPIEDAIAQAWSRERAGLTSNTYDLAYHAIRLGDPEALRRSIAHLSGLTNPDDRSDNGKRELLDKAVDQPAGTNALTWAHSHFAQLQFDPDRQVFFLPN